MLIFTAIASFAAGYAASIYTWTEVKTFWLGASAVANSLRNKAAALEAAVKAL